MSDPSQLAEVLGARFVAKIAFSSQCWIWQGSKRPNANGDYGTFLLQGRLVGAHRAAYEAVNGPIPDGMTIDHVCSEPSCVRPDHLRLATHKQNMEHHAAVRRDNTSGVRGVHLKDGRWRVTAQHNGQKMHGGYFSDMQEAERAAIRLRLSIFTHSNEDLARLRELDDEPDRDGHIEGYDDFPETLNDMREEKNG